MPLLMIIVFVAASTANGASSSIIDQYPTDTIKLLWATLGVVMSFVTLILGGVSVWALKKIMEHDKDIVAIKTGCVGHIHRRSTDENHQ